MSKNAQKIGWIGTGRMGMPMAERLLKAGHEVSVWNRTRAKAEPLAAKGGRIVDKLADLASCDVVFSIVSEGKDLEQVYFGKDGVLSGGKAPKICIDCSTISVEESADIRKRLKEKGADYVCAPVSGNAKVIKAGRLSSVVSGDEAACKSIIPLMEVVAPQGVSYVGESDLARICKIAHNVMLGVVIENLIAITLLVNKMGVPRHAFLAFLNNGVMGSMFTRYKAPALVNLDWTTTFTPELLRKGRFDEIFFIDLPDAAERQEILRIHLSRRGRAPEGFDLPGLAARAEHSTIVVATSGDVTPAYGCADAQSERFEASAVTTGVEARVGYMTVLVYGHEEHVV